MVDDDPAPATPPTPQPPVVEEPTVQPLQVLGKQDVAEVLGQFPHKDAMPADWAEPRVISKLLQNHQLAFETWKRAAMEGALDSTPRSSMEFTTTTPGPLGEDYTVRAGKVAVPTGMTPPAPLPPVFSARLPNAAEDDISVRAGIAYPAPDPCHVDGPPREVTGMAVRARVRFDDDSVGDGDGPRLDTNASVRFGRNVASAPEDYARKFGHYHDLPNGEANIDSNDSQHLQAMPSLQGMGGVDVVYGHSKVRCPQGVE